MNQEWLINKDDLEIYYDKLLGSGQYGTIYLAKWRKTIVVAKLFHKVSDQQINLIKKEIQIMTKLHHPNIIQLFGYMTNPFIIVMEYIEGTNLNNIILFDNLINSINSFGRISYKTKVNICLQIARGLVYLHQRKPTYIIHRDLKPTNILITKEFKVKIIDFGVSKLLSNNGNIIISSNPDLTTISADGKTNTIVYTNNVGTVRYMAPEVYKTSVYSYKIDIYSLGIIMYELFEDKRYDLDESSSDKFKIKILKNFKASWSCFMGFHRTSSKIRKLVEQCWDLDSTKRPSANEIVTYLEKL